MDESPHPSPGEFTILASSPGEQKAFGGITERVKGKKIADTNGLEVDSPGEEQTHRVNLFQGKLVG